MACGKKFQEGQRVLNVCRYVTNYKRGDFVTDGQRGEYVHLTCVINAVAD
jgi:hypothetical protein